MKQVIFACLAAASALADAQPEIKVASLSDPSLLKVPAIIDNNTRSVVFGVVPGTDLTTLAPVLSFNDEDTTSTPASGVTTDLSHPHTYRLYSQGAKSIQWTIKAIEMRSPVLSGLYADPNIAVFGDKYYIYSTTDGFPDWGGQVFYVWSSSNLIDWTRTEEPILTLNGTSGNVPWATGNAWAPTIAERDGKYYIYFSGNNPAYDAKNIGVAVADSPLGPFTAQPEPMITNTEPLHASQAIDPCAFHDPMSGKYFLYWGNGNALRAELSSNMTSLVPGTTTEMTGLTNFTEASFVVYKKPYYHYTFSNGNTNDPSYYVGYATSSDAAGPWDYHGKILQQRPAEGILATGSSSTIHVPGTEDWYIAYHRFAIPGGNGSFREVTIDRVKFDDAGFMRVVRPTLSSVEGKEIGEGGYE